MATGVASTRTQVPNARSFGELKREVADFVRSPDDPEALDLAGIGINDAIRSINFRQWYWSVAFQYIGLVQDQMDYALVSDFKRSMVMEKLKANGHSSGKFRYYEPQEFLEIYRESRVGSSPEAATIFNAQASPMISLNVGPSAVFVNIYPRIRHIYYRKFPILSTDDQTVGVPSEVELYLAAYGRERVASVYRPQLFSLAQQERLRAWTGLVADQSEHHTSNWSV